jgi:hypothetical protein
VASAIDATSSGLQKLTPQQRPSVGVIAVDCSGHAGRWARPATTTMTVCTDP